MKSKINSFRREYAFLSNFYHCTVEYEGCIYPSVEHAFQAAKTFDLKWRNKIRVCPTPAAAKYWGRRVPMRPDWEKVKISIMKQLVKDKFSRNLSYRTNLKQQLLDTGEAYLEEGNAHGDTFWGTVHGEGQNWLGKVLMEVRSEICKEEKLDV